MAIDLKGMTIEDIRGLDTRKLSTKELKQVTNRLVSASNKRVRRLMADEYGQHSPTAERARQNANNQLFSTKGLDTRAKVKAEFDRARAFLDPSKKTHTVRGWRRTTAKMEKAGVKKEQLTSGDFWSTYRRFARDYVPGMYDSFALLSIISTLTEQGFGDDDIENYLRGDYEENEIEEDYFEDVEGEFSDFFD